MPRTLSEMVLFFRERGFGGTKAVRSRPRASQAYIPKRMSSPTHAALKRTIARGTGASASGIPSSISSFFGIGGAVSSERDSGESRSSFSVPRGPFSDILTSG